MTSRILIAGAAAALLAIGPAAMAQPGPAKGNTSGPATGSTVVPSTAVQKNNSMAGTSGTNDNPSLKGSLAAGAPGVAAKRGSESGKEPMPSSSGTQQKP